MIGALVFANPGRPVAARRRRSRSRTARTTGKEHVMARTRSRRRGRRRMARNAKGHFVKRSTRRTRRSRRRNPSGFIKVGRRWKKMTKYASRRKRGRRKGQIRGFHFPKRYRRSRRRVRRNPVVVSNPGRRRRRRSHSRRTYRHVRRNPAASYRLSSDPIGAIKNALMSAFSVDTLETLVQMGLGFGGSITASKFLSAELANRFNFVVPSAAKPLVTLASSALLTGLSSFLKKPQLSARVLTGGLFATLWQGLSMLVEGTQVQQYVPTLSGAETDQFRRAIEKEVLKELRGGGVNGYLRAAGSEGVATYMQPAGIEYLRPAGSEAYLTEIGAERAQAGMGAYLTEVNAEHAEAGMGDDEFSRRGMPEKF